MERPTSDRPLFELTLRVTRSDVGRWLVRGLALATVALPALLFASAVSIPNTFATGTVADAASVNANFSALAAGSNDNHVRLAELEKRQEIVVHTGNGYGTTNTCIRRFGTLSSSKGAALLTYADSATLGGSWTNTSGKQLLVTMTYTDRRVSGCYDLGISVNAASGSSTIAGMTPAQGGRGFNNPCGVSSTITWSGLLEPNDVLRAHSGGAPTNQPDASGSAVMTQATVVAVAPQ